MMGSSKEFRGILMDMITLREHVLSAPYVTIGRDSACPVSLNWDPTVSREHAVLRFLNGLFVVEDLGSKNGTQVNGNRIAGPVCLKTGDVVTVGAVRFVFFVAPVGDSLKQRAA